MKWAGAVFVRCESRRASRPAAKAEHCELARFAVNFPLLEKHKTAHVSGPTQRGRDPWVRAGEKWRPKELPVRAGADCGPLYGGPNSGEWAGPALPLWAARAARRAFGLLMRQS